MASQLEPGGLVAYGSSSDADRLAGSTARTAELDVDFADFVRTHQHSLIGFARLITGSHHDAQDLVQTALIKAYPKWAKLRAGQHAEAYLRTIIVHEHASIWRRAWRRRERSTDDPRVLERQTSEPELGGPSMTQPGRRCSGFRRDSAR